MIQLDFRSRIRTKKTTPAASVGRNPIPTPTATPTKKHRLRTTPTWQPCCFHCCSLLGIELDGESQPSRRGRLCRKLQDQPFAFLSSWCCFIV